MADPSVTMIAIDNQFLFWLVCIFATIVGVLLVTLARVVVMGVNKTFNNHEIRIQELEHAVFKPINGGNYGHDHVP